MSVTGPNALDQTTDVAGAILAGVDFSREDLGRSVELVLRRLKTCARRG